MPTKDKTFSFTCTQENLLKALAKVAPIAGRSTQLPILQYVLFQAKNGVLQLTTTDLEIGVVTSIGGTLKGDGVATLPARSVFSYVQQLPKTHPITITQEKSGVRIETKNFSAVFTSASSDDFPLLPVGGDGKKFSIPASELCSGVEQVIFSAARDETRPEIRGVYIGSDEDATRYAATDSFRLAESVAPSPLASSGSFILPLVSAQEVVRIFSDQDTVEVSVQENYIVFSSSEVEFTSRLIDGSYPNYQQIIPSSVGTTVFVDRDELLRSLKTLTVFLPSGSRRVEFVVNPDSEHLRAQVTGGESGAGVVEVGVSGDGKPVTVLVNIQYLLEGLQHIKTSKCEIGLTSDSSPIIMKPTGKDAGFVYVVMPIRT